MTEKLPAGQVVASRYTVEKVVGRGSFGWLYKAADAERGEPVFLYVLADGVGGASGALEFKLWLAALYRRGSQDIHDYASADGTWFVTLRYEPGKGVPAGVVPGLGYGAG